MTAALLGMIGLLAGGHLYTAWILDGDRDPLAHFPATLGMLGVAVIVGVWVLP